MTFVRGPEEAVFRDDQQAKLRFFMGYADEFAREDGAEEVCFDRRVKNTGRSNVPEGRLTLFAHADVAFAEQCLF